MIGVGSLVRVSLLLNFEWLDEVLVYVVAMKIDISDRVFKSVGNDIHRNNASPVKS